MLTEILKEFKAAEGPIDLNELGRRLDVEHSALEGMLQMLVKQGKLREIEAGSETCSDCDRRKECAYLQAGVSGGSKRSFRMAWS